MEGVTQKPSQSITYKQLGLLLICFISGFISALLLQNSKMSSQITFTTTELIGFVIGLILAGASIVLAIAAINLGKSSEQSVIKRSDESIRLQNDVFIKTTEALQRIEASTGVTEKRLEDIISGRVGDISHKIAQLTTTSKGLTISREDIEKEIKSSILNELHGTISGRGERSDDTLTQTIKDREQRYKSYQKRALDVFAKRDDMRATKLGDGEWTGQGLDLYDGIFVCNNQNIGVSTFTTDAFNTSSPFFATYLTNVAISILDRTVQYVILIFDSDASRQKDIETFVAARLSYFKDDTASHVRIIATPIDALDQLISDYQVQPCAIQSVNNAGA